MPSTRPGAHIGAGKTPSIALLEMFWLFAQVSGEVQIGWQEGETEGRVEWREIAFGINVLDDKADATAILCLNTSRAPGQSVSTTDQRDRITTLEKMINLFKDWTAQHRHSFPNTMLGQAKILVLFQLSPQCALILFPSVAHVNNDEVHMDAFLLREWRGVGVCKHTCAAAQRGADDVLELNTGRGYSAQTT
ncbi:predicted protein [Postia placenta Mad-698-R]|uniref:N-acetyltransferase domain-containing protein n=1 Tax=Postia placenta MAD-698-R-SB12 TaxID=670580 RepID=A0A1X6MJH6_9APHY|nr:hypothetical protein POSPLADRAFT_1160726 [Postia placenta MAD-698-R-SB12]EED85753.1 predicted protein [Postia placenta Mad-698-R]OSX56193.1 hypothetical protein POSPLADRAFT_1160726 [Postia placenta MAD-698-R-SB12]